MNAAKLNQVVRHLRAAAGPPAAGPTDRQFLAAFTARGDEAAFAALVGRHGPMVLRVCRRVLRQEQDAEDAFQATFLVLARKAGSIRRTEALASWLHGVAHRVALRARRDAGRRRVHEREARAMPANTGAGEADWREIQAALDEEIRSLPEKYRAPFVLCFLEGKSRAEAAGELGLKEGTVWSRLSQARKLLQERLGRRGIALPALLAAAAISGGAARAVPARLFDATVRAVLSAGAASARAAALAKLVGGALPTSKVNAVILCLVTTGLLAFGGVFLKADDPTPPPAGGPKPAGQPAAAIADAGEAGKFRGRVLDPDGKPLGGARVFVVPFYDESSALGPVRATTGADGRFEFDAPDLTYTGLDGLPARREGLVVVTNDGYAPDWFHTWGDDHRGIQQYWDPVQGAAVNLQLAKDDVPIRGRFLDPAGRPLAGARVRLTGLMTPKGRDLGAHLEKWSKASAFSGFLSRVPNYERELWRPRLLPGLTTETRTDADGRFTLSGLGRDRIADLKVSAPGVVDTALQVMTRAAPDTRILSADGGANAGTVIHGAGFTLRLEPGLTVKGRVIDRDTREPIPGMWVGPLQNAVNQLAPSLYPWVTDADGRFTITGLDPRMLTWDGAHRTVVAVAAPGLPYQTAWVAVKGTEDVVIECRRGIPFRLTLVDERGRPVEAEVTYADVQPNDNVVHDEVTWPVSHAARTAGGTYQGFVLSGPGAVLVKTPRRAGYRPARVDPKAFFAPGRANWTAEEQATAYGTPDTLTTSNGRYIGTIYRGSTLDQRDYAAIVLVNPPPDSGPLRLSATVVRDRPRRVSLVDPDGRPVVGAEMIIEGVQTLRTMLRAASFPLTGLHPDRVQLITFIKEDRRLIGQLQARGDGDAPSTVRMQAWGTVTGRVVDENGKPLADAAIWFKADGADPWVGGKTDVHGRFRGDRVIPGLGYSVATISQGRLSAEPSAGTLPEKLVLRPGEVRDLGDIRIKPAAGGR
jgi:RNA polymerase sigma factor (sigma-70 family)